MTTGPLPGPDDWERKFEAVARLYREANECLAAGATDVLGAALRARQVIEHISDYLHVREIGPVATHDMLDAKLKRLAAKGLLSRREQIHFGTVQIHTNFLIHPELLPRDPDRRELEPCLASLSIIVDWFFGDYLRRPVPELVAPVVQPPAVAPARPDATPVSSTSATAEKPGTRFGTGFGEFIPVWRTRATASTLRFDAPEGEPLEQRVFKIEGSDARYFIGQARRKDGTPNDFSLPWSSVSRDQGVIAIAESGVTFTNTSGRKNAFVRGELVPDGATRALRHGDSIQLGRSVGTFADGRYYGPVPAVAVDAVTGLLSRAGLVTEMSGYLAAGKPRALFVARCTGASEIERAAAEIALALHRNDVAVPVARIGGDVAVLLAPDGAPFEVLGAIAMGIAGNRGVGCATGYLPLAGGAEQATPQLEACLGALARLAIAGREPRTPEDLTRSALVPTPVDAFPARARAAFDAGGGAVLFALGDLDRLDRLAPGVRAVLELELVEVLGARMGPRDTIAFAGPGLIGFATPGDVERIARDIAVEWHARGPVTVATLEIDRSLSPHLLALADAEDLATRAPELARDGVGAFGVGGFPAPIALAARMLDDPDVAATRTARLLRLADATWQLLAIILVSAVRAAKTGHDTPPAASGSWRELACAAADRLAGQPAGRTSELATAVLETRGGKLAASMEAISEPGDRARLERALRELLAGFATLGGWTLVAIESSEVVDVEGTTQRIEYLDYTGPTARGSRQHVSVVGFRGLGRFVYLVRWAEGLAIALEPFVRRARNEATGEHELVVATAPITSAGRHLYRSISSGRELELEVTAKQVG